MPKTESALKNETYKILWDFKIQTDHLIPARRPDLTQNKSTQKKENVTFSGLCHSSGP